jgi:hypothetical protein
MGLKGVAIAAIKRRDSAGGKRVWMDWRKVGPRSSSITPPLLPSLFMGTWFCLWVVEPEENGCAGVSRVFHARQLPPRALSPSFTHADAR